MTSPLVDRHFWVGPGTERVTTPSLPSSLVFLAALWLGFAPWVLHYARAGGGVASSEDVLVSIVVCCFALARMVVPRDAPGLSVANALLGLRLIVAPFLLGGELPRARVNDLVVGILLLGLAGLSAVQTYRQRAIERSLSREEGWPKH